MQHMVYDIHHLLQLRLLVPEKIKIKVLLYSRLNLKKKNDLKKLFKTKQILTSSSSFVTTTESSVFSLAKVAVASNPQISSRLIQHLISETTYLMLEKRNFLYLLCWIMSYKTPLKLLFDFGN